MGARVLCLFFQDFLQYYPEAGEGREFTLAHFEAFTSVVPSTIFKLDRVLDYIM
jgi:hypothetical protein